ncbi:MAG TPA: hypothetical protein VMV87_02985 [Burkholderiales bacterium]|nr:hypothetical protein [Burkholderiales bacterium]
MTNNRNSFAGMIAALIIVGAVAALCSEPTQAAKPVESAQAASTTPGTVELTRAQRTASGIETQTLRMIRFQPETRTHASVLDPGPLLQLRGQLRAAQVQTDAARAEAAASGREYRRLALLNSQGHTVSDKVTEAAHAAWETDRAHLQSAQAILSAARDTARSRWGGVLTGWALAARSPQLDALDSGQQALLSVALPRSGAMRSLAPTIRVVVPATGGSEITAQLVSPSPLADPLTQSATYFYRAPRAGLRTGMRVEALSPAGQALDGVTIPNSAVVWYANRPWAYVQSDATHFTRREITVDTPAPGGWFVAQGWRGGERVVVKGAALLLSQEFQPPPQPAGSGGGDDDDD